MSNHSLSCFLFLVTQDCGLQLTDEADKRCYPLDGQLFCHSCHIARLNVQFPNETFYVDPQTFNIHNRGSDGSSFGRGLLRRDSNASQGSAGGSGGSSGPPSLMTPQQYSAVPMQAGLSTIPSLVLGQVEGSSTSSHNNAAHNTAIIPGTAAPDRQHPSPMPSSSSPLNNQHHYYRNGVNGNVVGQAGLGRNQGSLVGLDVQMESAAQLSYSQPHQHHHHPPTLSQTSYEHQYQHNFSNNNSSNFKTNNFVYVEPYGTTNHHYQHKVSTMGRGMSEAACDLTDYKARGDSIGSSLSHSSGGSQTSLQGGSPIHSHSSIMAHHNSHAAHINNVLQRGDHVSARMANRMDNWGSYRGHNDSMSMTSAGGDSIHGSPSRYAVLMQHSNHGSPVRRLSNDSGRPYSPATAGPTTIVNPSMSPGSVSSSNYPPPYSQAVKPTFRSSPSPSPSPGRPSSSTPSSAYYPQSHSPSLLMSPQQVPPPLPQRPPHLQNKQPIQHHNQNNHPPILPSKLKSSGAYHITDL